MVFSDAYKRMAIRCRAAAAGGVPRGPARIVLGWLRETRPATFTVRDLKRARESLARDEAGLDDALAALVRAGAIRPIANANATGKIGRPRSASYEVSPKLYDA